MSENAMSAVGYLEKVNAGSQFAALEALDATLSGDAVGDAEAFHKLMMALYWEHKNLAAVVAVANAGIGFCIQQATGCGLPAQVELLRSLAKSMAYDLASFTWPGWDEPGIAPTPDQVALGLQAARYNLQLAVELQKPPDRLRSAHWLLGAQLLANKGDGKEALEHFRQAIPPEGDEYYAMFCGYVILARQMGGERAALGEWDSLIGRLGAGESEAAKCSFVQLTAAYRVLVLQMGCM